MEKLVLSDVIVMAIGYLQTLEDQFRPLQKELEEKFKQDPKFKPTELEDLKYQYLMSSLVMIVDILHPVYDKSEEIVPVAADRFKQMKQNLEVFRTHGMLPAKCPSCQSCKNDMSEKSNA